MAHEPLGTFIRQLRRVVGPPEGGLTDAQLLERWAAGRDQAAFEVLLWRHGGMVLRVCRRLLADPNDVDDAFQATFLTLVRRAGSIRKRESLAAWLHSVAYRVALRARARRQQRAARETAGVEWLGAEPEADALGSDLRPVLDEEIQRLPAKYRSVFVLCYLQGQSNEEAARALGCPVGTVYSRLSWARRRLQGQLTRRGITVPGTLFITLLVQQNAGAAAPAYLVDMTLKAAVAYAAGTATAGVVSAQAVALTEGVVRSMFLTKLKIAVALALAIGLVGGAGAWAYLAESAPSGPRVTTVAADEAGLPEERQDTPRTNTPPAADDKAQGRLIEVASARDGIVKLVGIHISKPVQVPKGTKVLYSGMVLEEGGQLPADREVVTVREHGLELRYLIPKVGDKVEAGWVVVWLDNRLAEQEALIKRAKLAAAQADLKAAEATLREAEARLEAAKKLFDNKAVSAEEYRAAQTTAERYRAEFTSKTEAITVAFGEKTQAETIVQMHRVSSPAHGVITRIYKHPGEAVKALEPVFQIRLTEKDK